MSRLELIKFIRNTGVSFLALNSKTDIELQDMYDALLTEAPAEVEYVVNINAYDKYKAEFIRQANLHGIENTFTEWTCGPACCCMGPQNGDPLCRCMMYSQAARMLCKVVLVV